MNGENWKEWTADQYAVGKISAGKECSFFFVKNGSSNSFDNRLDIYNQKISNTLFKLSASATNFVQHAEYFVIQKPNEM